MKKLWLMVLVVSLLIQYGCDHGNDPEPSEVSSKGSDSSNSSDKSVCNN